MHALIPLVVVAVVVVVAVKAMSSKSPAAPWKSAEDIARDAAAQGAKAAIDAEHQKRSEAAKKGAATKKANKEKAG